MTSDKPSLRVRNGNSFLCRVENKAAAVTLSPIFKDKHGGLQPRLRQDQIQGFRNHTRYTTATPQDRGV